jgi:hypothetical protein
MDSPTCCNASESWVTPKLTLYFIVFERYEKHSETSRVLAQMFVMYFVAFRKLIKYLLLVFWTTETLMD